MQLVNQLACVVTQMRVGFGKYMWMNATLYDPDSVQDVNVMVYWFCGQQHEILPEEPSDNEEKIKIPTPADGGQYH